MTRLLAGVARTSRVTNDCDLQHVEEVPVLVSDECWGLRRRVASRLARHPASPGAVARTAEAL